MGVNEGDVIGILSLNCLEYTDVYGAAQKGGFIASPFNPRLNISELEYLINYSEANTLFVGPEMIETVSSLRSRLPNIKNYISFESPATGMALHHDLVTTYPTEEPDIQVGEDDFLFIFYTSGTTSLPRGALYSQRSAIDNTRTFVISHGLQPENRNIIIMPLFHIGGIECMLGYFYVGSSSVIMKSFDPTSTLQTIQNEKATDIQIVPTHLAAIFNLPDYEKYALGSLKRIFHVGSPMPVQLLKKGLKTWGPIFSQGYGQTESGPGITVLPNKELNILDKSDEEQVILTSCGQPHIGVHVRIVNDQDNDVEAGEIGEIICQSKHIMAEYWHKPDDTCNSIIDGWLHTGDMGFYDEKGYIYIVDRKRDMIISGGENIYPREVEEVLNQHPAVQEAAVIGVSDPYWVERVHAVVVLKEMKSANADELIVFCKQKLAGYKAPKSIECVDSLPKNASGKVLKRELKKTFSSGEL
jgi:acyl-CoA synthetase (AMP-forming)/AMP-acid ligase II